MSQVSEEKNSTDKANKKNEVITPEKKSNKKLFIIIGVVVFFIFILPGILLTVVFGYVAHRGGDKIVEDIAKSKGVDLDVNSKDGNVSFKDKDGNEYSSKTSKKLPDDFPKNEITLYSDNYTNTSRIKVGESISWSVVMETDDSPEMITQKVKDQLVAKSWEIQSESNSNDYNMIIAKKNPYSAIINYRQDGAKTILTYTISKADTTQ